MRPPQSDLNERVLARQSLGLSPDCHAGVSLPGTIQPKVARLPRARLINERKGVRFATLA